MKTSDLKNKSVEELRNELLSVQKEAFNLRMLKSTGQPSKQTHLPRGARKMIARIKTILREKGSFV